MRQEARTKAASKLLMTVSLQPDDRLELRDLDPRCCGRRRVTVPQLLYRPS